MKHANVKASNSVLVTLFLPIHCLNNRATWLTLKNCDVSCLDLDQLVTTAMTTTETIKIFLLNLIQEHPMMRKQTSVTDGYQGKPPHH